MTPRLELRHLSKRFGTFAAVDDVSLTVARGEFLTLLGASGSGKTTTLRLIAGFEAPTSGAILLDGVDAAHDPASYRQLQRLLRAWRLTAIAASQAGYYEEIAKVRSGTMLASPAEEVVPGWQERLAAARAQAR